MEEKWSICTCPYGYTPEGFREGLRLTVCFSNSSRARARLIAEAPAMRSLLEEAVSRVEDLVTALGKDNIEVEDLAAWSDDARDLLARIDKEDT